MPACPPWQRALPNTAASAKSQHYPRFAEEETKLRGMQLCDQARMGAQDSDFKPPLLQAPGTGLDFKDRQVNIEKPSAKQQRKISDEKETAWQPIGSVAGGHLPTGLSIAYWLSSLSWSTKLSRLSQCRRHWPHVALEPLNCGKSKLRY